MRILLHDAAADKLDDADDDDQHQHGHIRHVGHVAVVAVADGEVAETARAQLQGSVQAEQSAIRDFFAAL